MVVRARTRLAAICALTFLGSAAVSHAETPGVQLPTITADNLGVRTIDPIHWNAPPAHKSLLWDQKGRWGLKLDMSQPVGRDMQLRDVQAGAFYRVTPSLRVGGAVALSNQPAEPDRTLLPSVPAPQVKLETTFKF